MKDWDMMINTLGNRISSGNRTEEVDMSMWDTLFPLAKEESCGTHVARYLATYQGDKYELFEKEWAKAGDIVSEDEDL